MTWTPSEVEGPGASGVAGDGTGGAGGDPPSDPPDGPRLGVVIPAAGVGTRMGGRKKAFLLLGGCPLLLRTLDPFLAHPGVGAIAVALPPEEYADPPGYLTGLDPRVTLARGGDTRQDSVHAAVQALPDDVQVILVHDAARPLVTREIMDRCVAQAMEGEGGVASWPAIDTLQEVDGDERVVETPDRARLRAAQTPQVFPAAPFREALARARAEGFQGTDDAAVFAWAGGRVRMVPGDRWNLKVTVPDDLVVAEALLRARRDAGPRLTLLFVCTGNTCRSPMAQALARAEAKRRGWKELQVLSAGIAATPGEGAAEGARRAVGRRGLSLEAHQATELSAPLVARADLILALSPGHFVGIDPLGGREKAALLTAFAGGALPGTPSARGGAGVPDPFGGDDARYEATLEILDALVREALDRLPHQGRPPAEGADP